MLKSCLWVALVFFNEVMHSPRSQLILQADLMIMVGAVLKVTLCYPVGYKEVIKNIDGKEQSIHFYYTQMEGKYLRQQFYHSKVLIYSQSSCL